MKKTLVLTSFAAMCFAFVSLNAKKIVAEPEPIAPSKQRTGNASIGYNYLITGDYLKSGIPYSLFFMGAPKDTNNFLQRTGNNEFLAYNFTAVKAPNGELVAAPNCLQCHAQIFEDKLVVGLGNSLSDFTINQQSTALLAEMFLKNMKGENAKKYDAAKAFITSIKTISPKLITSTKGVNLADALAYLLVSHRDPKTLKWSDTSLLKLPAETIPTDVPAGGC